MPDLIGQRLGQYEIVSLLGEGGMAVVYRAHQLMAGRVARDVAIKVIEARLAREVDAILDGGDCGTEPTTVVDLSVTPPVIVRHGKGDLGPIVGRAL